MPFCRTRATSSCAPRLKLNATIVPLKLEGLFEIKQRFLTRKMKIPRARAGELSIRFGKPIQTASLGKPSEITRLLESAVGKLSFSK